MANQSMRDNLRFEHVSFSYQMASEGRHQIVPVLDNISFSVASAEFVSLIGPSGSGKSTVFYLISGLLQPNEGEVILKGERNGDRLGKVGVMPQKDLLMPWRTVAENAALILEIKGIKKKETERRVREMLPIFGLEEFADQIPSQLSGGMRQRVSFLRTVLAGNEILLLDEPFSSLDAITRASMQQWLLHMWEKWKQTVVFITHDVEEAILLSDRIFVMSERPTRQLIEITVPFSRPRQYGVVTTSDFLQLKERLVNLLVRQEGELTQSTQEVMGDKEGRW